MNTILEIVAIVGLEQPFARAVGRHLRLTTVGRAMTTLGEPRMPRLAMSLMTAKSSRRDLKIQCRLLGAKRLFGFEPGGPSPARIGLC
jgi:hypothetical protein